MHIVKIKLVLPFLFFHLFSFSLCAQSYLRSGSMMIDPRTLMSDQFLILPLPIKNNGRMNVIDQSNPYTSVELITASNGKTYQILLQTDFFGELTCLAISKNLENRLTGKSRPQLAFRSCLGRIYEAGTALRKKEAAVDCIMLQLEHPDLPR
jgi:hypothetical protein